MIQVEGYVLITKRSWCIFQTREEAEYIAKILESSGVATIILPESNAPTRYETRRNY